MADEIYKPTVYVETTIPSYLTAWPTCDLRRVSHQQITKAWWRTAASQYELFVSHVVVKECRRGDVQAAAERMAVLGGITLLSQSQEAIALSVRYVQLLKLLVRAAADALHIADATLYGLDYLVTWNMQHYGQLPHDAAIDRV